MTEKLLLDSNLLIALSFPDHFHHSVATSWFRNLSPQFATCPVTQGSLAKFAIRTHPQSPALAQTVLKALVGMDGHQFWPDDLPYTTVAWKQISGHKQVTDAYLVALAKHHDGILATLDKSLATIFSNALLVS